jgi:hypothetical protein
MANKLSLFILVFTGLTLLFYFSGLLTTCEDGVCESSSPNSALLSILLNPLSFNIGSFATKVAIVLSALAIATITIGFFNNNTELAARSTFGIYLLSLLWDFIVVVGKVYAENPVIAILLFSPILILFVITFIDWVVKND